MLDKQKVSRSGGREVGDESLQKISKNETVTANELIEQMQRELNKRGGDIELYQNLTIDLTALLKGERALRKEQDKMRQNSTLANNDDRESHLELIQDQRDVLDDAKDVIDEQKERLETSALADIKALNEANKTRQQIRELSRQMADIIASNEETGSIVHSL